MTHHYITVNGIRMHYVEQGRGPLVVLLHGFPEFWYGWRHQIPVLAQRYRVVAPDLRGYNLSDKPLGVKNYSLDKLAADVAALITALGETSAVIVGHDWGGAVAWTLASLHPELVTKLAVLNIPHPAEMKKALYGFNWAQIKRSTYMFFFQLPWLPERYIMRNIDSIFQRLFVSYSPARKALTAEENAMYIAAFKQPGALTASLNYYRAAFRYPVTLPQAKLPMPVLMLWGVHDKALGRELTVNTAQYCSQLQLIYDETSGHFVQHDNPDWVNERLMEFIG
jgi:pimeloyl-ACP methyl ester carboxylesterase